MTKFLARAALSAAILLPPVVLAAPATAQDMGSPPYPDAAPATTVAPFIGPRVEATIGWDQLSYDLAGYGGSGRGRVSDLTWGGAIGYDVALSPRLLGGAEIGVTGGDGEQRTGGTRNGGYLSRRREVDAAVRLGTAVTPNTLLYGKVGYTNLQIGQDRTIAGVTSSQLRDLDGLLLGAGAEVKMSQRLYLKAEYRHTNYSYDYDGNAVVTGIGLRF